MKVSFAHGRIRIIMNMTEATEFTRQVPGAFYKFSWDEQERVITVINATNISHWYSSLVDSGAGQKHKLMELGWSRQSIVDESTRHPIQVPVFGMIYIPPRYVDDKLLLTIPPADRLPPVRKRVVINRKSSASGAAHGQTASSPMTATIKVTDTLERLRHHRNALNKLRERDIDAINFKIKPDGFLALEVLLDE